MKYSGLVLIFLTLLFVGCQKDKDISSLDLELEKLLKSKAENGALDYFQFPASDDYQNIPSDPNNPLTKAKIELGKLLFHETGCGANPKINANKNTYSCSSCHHVAAGFQAGVPQGIGEGGIGFGHAGESRRPQPSYPRDSLDVQPVRSPAALNIAYQEAVLWNGQFGATGINTGTEERWEAGTPIETNHLGYQGTETQAIAGLKVHRMSISEEFLEEFPEYRNLFDEAFPELDPSTRYTRVSAGLAIAAYERTLLANQAPFQKWLQGDLNAMSDEMKKGAILFFDKGKCVDCHTGPALNSMEFHALGMPDLKGPGVYGNFLNDKSYLGRGSFTLDETDFFKFKVPQLYNLIQSPFYGHGGSFTSIEEVINYKNQAQSANDIVPTDKLSEEFKPLSLAPNEIQLITEFIMLGLYDNNLNRYVPNVLPSGYCFPNNDVQSKFDLGCQ